MKKHTIKLGLTGMPTSARWYCDICRPKFVKPVGRKKGKENKHE